MFGGLPISESATAAFGVVDVPGVPAVPYRTEQLGELTHYGRQFLYGRLGRLDGFRRLCTGILQHRGDRDADPISILDLTGGPQEKLRSGRSGMVAGDIQQLIEGSLVSQQPVVTNRP